MELSSLVLCLTHAFFSPFPGESHCMHFVQFDGCFWQEVWIGSGYAVIKEKKCCQECPERAVGVLAFRVRTGNQLFSYVVISDLIHTSYLSLL